MKNQFKVGDAVKALVNNKHWLRGKVFDINNDIAVVVIPVYYSNMVEYMVFEYKINDLREVKETL